MSGDFMVRTHLPEPRVTSMMRRLTSMMDRYRENPGLIGRERVLPGSGRCDRGLPRVGPWELENSDYKRAYVDARERGISLFQVAKEYGLRSSNLYLWAKTRGLPRHLAKLEDEKGEMV